MLNSQYTLIIITVCAQNKTEACSIKPQHEMCKGQIAEDKKIHQKIWTDLFERTEKIAVSVWASVLA